MTLTEMGAKRRLLFLLPFAPRLDATHGGSRAIAQLLEGLAPRHQIGLLYLRGLGEPPIDEILSKRCELVEEVVRPLAGWPSAQRWLLGGRLITSLFCLRPLWVTDCASRAYAARVRSLAQTWRPDLVQIEFHVMAQYAHALDGCRAPRVLVEHEPGIMAAPYPRLPPGRIGGILNRIDKRAWERFERAIIQKVQTVVVHTEPDRKAIERLVPQAHIVTISLGSVIPKRPANPVGCPPLNLLFFGSFTHRPNVDAASRLIRNIFPIVRQQYPELMLYIVGDQPPPQLKEMAGERIIVTGRVPDLTPYLDRAAICVVPLRLGGGMRVKVLEALAAGKAIIASHLAVEGLHLEDGQQVALAESDEEFCRATVQLIGHPEGRMHLATQARTWAYANLGWEKVITSYEALYTKLIEWSPME